MTRSQPKLAFTAKDSAMRYQLWLYDPVTGLVRRLTNGQADAGSIPYWSPDQRKIAFAGGGLLYVFDARTRASAKLDTAAPGFTASWSPDSTRLAYADNGKIRIYFIYSYEWYNIALNGAEKVSWFPDGQTLLVTVRMPNGSYQLRRMDAYGGSVQTVYESGAPIHDTALSPDGTSVLYTSPGASISIIYRVLLSNGQVEQLPSGSQGKNYRPVWSPDSQMIAFSSTEYNGSASRYYSDIKIMRAHGLQAVTAQQSDCYSTPISFMPDSRWISWLSGCDADANASLVMLSPAGTGSAIPLLRAAAVTAIAWCC